MRSGAVADELGELAERVRPVTLTREQRLTVLPALEGLLPGGGLRRGATVSVGSSAGAGGATSLAMALVAEASQHGSWVAAVGLPSLGLVAADELGVALERLVLVAAPERDAWGGVVAALVDGFDVVLLHAGRTGVRTVDARRLVARARERGAVLLQLGSGWPEKADVQLEVVRSRWEGLEDGHGRLLARKVRVVGGGRGEAAQPRRLDLWLPGPDGEVCVAEPLVVPQPEPVSTPEPLVEVRPLRAVSQGMTGAVRTLVVWCPDWPIVAAGVSLDVPAAVFHANRVVATSPAARAQDIVRHHRRREAQARCPSLLVLDRDLDRDARVFEPVVAALDALTPRVEITEPGRVAFPTRGPSRFFGGDDALAARTHAVVTEALADRGTCQVGVADGIFAATLAAQAGEPIRVVPPDRSAEFLAGWPVTTLDRPELTDVWSRLGLTTLGAVAALAEADVVARFGTDGQVAWRLACGFDERPPALAPPPEDLTASVELDPPAETMAPAAFLARGLAEELHDRLWARGSACTRVVIGAETEHGERLERVWRAEGSLTAGAIADRLRWQLDGWLQGSSRHRPTAGISRLWLTPDEVVPAGGRQLGFWGSDAATVDRASRAVARVQGLLGVGSVSVPEWRGSRDPATQVALIPAEAVDLTTERPGAGRHRVEGPWPGALPTPSPAWVHHDPVAAELVDADDDPVTVSGRGVLSAAPMRLSVDGNPWFDVVAWAGPWPLEERWWDTARRRRRARLQLVTADGQARLATLERGTWQVEATYD